MFDEKPVSRSELVDLRRQVGSYTAAIRKRVVAEIRGLKPLADPESWKKIRAAQGLIAAEPVPAQVWQGNFVRRIALAFGRRTDIRVDESGMYSVNYMRGDLAVNPAVVRRHSVRDVAGALVHEATHAAFGALVGELFRLTPPQCLVLLRYNARAGWFEHMSSEAMAFWNQAIWFRSDWLDIFDRASSVVHARGTHFIGFSRAIRQYVANGRGESRYHFNLPPVQLRGRNAGRVVDFRCLAPEVLYPFWEMADPFYPPAVRSSIVVIPDTRVLVYR